MIQLHGGYFLLIAETNGLLLKLDDTELVIKNQFVINAQPFSSQAGDILSIFIVAQVV